MYLYKYVYGRAEALLAVPDVHSYMMWVYLDMLICTCFLSAVTSSSEKKKVREINGTNSQLLNRHKAQTKAEAEGQ